MTDKEFQDRLKKMEHLQDDDVEEIETKDQQKQDSSYYTLTAGFRDLVRWIGARKWYIALFILIVVVHWRYHWSGTFGLIAGYLVGYPLMWHFISVDRVWVIETPTDSNDMDFYRIGKSIWDEINTEGYMAYHHLDGHPCYFSKDVDIDNREIEFCWFQDLDYKEFITRKSAYNEMRDDYVELLEKDVLHFAEPQIKGYSEAKRKIRKFIERMDEIYHQDQTVEANKSNIEEAMKSAGMDLEGSAEDESQS